MLILSLPLLLQFHELQLHANKSADQPVHANGLTHFQQPMGDIDALRYSTDGEFLVSGHRSGVVRVWRAADGCMIDRQCDSEKFPDVREVAISEDKSRIIALCNPIGIREFERRLDHYDPNAPTKQPVRWADFTSQGGLKMAMDDRGELAAYVDAERKLVLFDIRSSTQRFAILSDVAAPWQGVVSLSRDGRRLAACKSERLSVFDTQSREEIWDVQIAKRVQEVRFLSDTRVLVGTSAGDLYEYSATKRHRLFGSHGTNITELATDSQGRWFAAGDVSGYVSIWDASTGALLAQTQSGWRHAVMAMAASPDGTHLAFATHNFRKEFPKQPGTLVVWNLRDVLAK